ncbi:MAG: hypothetical protein KBF73_05985 [Flavobacteriales bacterium]|nr:hypothetical protein [Flavobacteriales bacterium]
MSIAIKRQQLVDRLMKVDADKTLEKVEEILIAAEMEVRAEESMQAIRDGNVVSLEQFSINTDEWLRKRRAMK